VKTKELVRQLTSCPDFDVVLIVPDNKQLSGYRVVNVIAVAIDQKDSQTPVTLLMWDNR
jgi:hypothetical protein